MVLTPNSGGTVYASPAPSYRMPPARLKIEVDEDEHNEVHVLNGHHTSDTASPTTTEHQRKKQKRNKPTLSCFECVERKTKASLQICFPRIL